MVVSCCAYNCKERFVKGGLLTFHSFPKDECRSKVWTVNLRRENFVPTVSSKLCSKHFTEDCFDREKFGGTWLKTDAVPTIFDFPKHLPKQLKRKLPKERTLSIDISPSTSDVHAGADREDITEPVSDMPMTTSQIGISNINTTLTTSNGKRKMNRKPENRDEETVKRTSSVSNCNIPVSRKGQKVTGLKSAKRKEDGKQKTKDTKTKFTKFNVSTVPLKMTKELNVGGSRKISTELVKLASDEGEMISDGSISSLPAKRCRKKKTFFGDFISEDWGLKSKRKKGIKTIQKADDVIEIAVTENKESEASRIQDNNLPKSLKENSEILEASCSTTKENHSSVRETTVPKGSYDHSSVSGQSSYTLEKGGSDADITSETKPKHEIKPPNKSRKGKTMLLGQATVALPAVHTCNLNSIPLEGSHHHSTKENSANCGELGTCLRNLAEGDNSRSANKEPKKGAIIFEDESGEVIGNNGDQSCLKIEKKRHVQSVPEVPPVASEEMSSHNEGKTKNIIEAFEEQNKEAVKQDSKYNSCIQSRLAVHSVSTSSEKISSILKLNLDEEEALLKKCIIHGKDNKKGKPLGSNKVTAANEDGTTTSSNEKCFTSLNYLKRKSYIGDFKVEDLVSPENAAKCFKTAQNVIREKDKRIKYLRRRERRLMKKVEELESVIFHLVEKKMNPEDASTVLIVLKNND